jgi:hypothetical protein
MKAELYSARIGDSRAIAEETTYEELVQRIMEFTVRAALARSIDESEWEHEELRRKGLRVLAILRDGRAVWADADTFNAELREARRLRDARFERCNELDASLYDRLDGDLRALWRCAGYESPTLLHDMKKLFSELEGEAADRAAQAREGLLSEIAKTR